MLSWATGSYMKSKCVWKASEHISLIGAHSSVVGFGLLFLMIKQRLVIGIE